MIGKREAVLPATDLVKQLTAGDPDFFRLSPQTLRATTLDKLYFDSDEKQIKECLNTFLQDVKYSLANKKTEDALIDDILRDDTPINATLYEVYSKNLRRAVDKVFYEDNGNGLSDCLRANVSRFAAYKAYHATQQVREQIAKDGDMDRARKVLHAFNRYQAAEYNTAVSRCRTAKQFEEFSAADNMRLFPNLRWLSSRSANPREQHMLFYNRVWAKDDPFWSQNQPGNLWNCKCDWEETADPVTDGNPETPIRHDGLEGNPAHTGEIFSDNCAYVKSCSNTKKKKVIKTMNEVEWLRTKNDKEKRERFNNINCSCSIVGENRDVKIISETYGEIAHAMAFSENHVLKNEGIERIPEWLKNAECIGRKESDTSHNTGKTKKLKERTDYFYYFKAKMYGKYDCYIHVGRYREDKKLYLYTIAEGAPQDLEIPIW